MLCPPDPRKPPGIEGLRGRIDSPGAGSPEAKHSRDAEPFSGMATSTALGSIFGGTASQQPLSPALCDPGCLQPPPCRALGHSQAHRWLWVHPQPCQSSSRDPQLTPCSERGLQHPMVPPQGLVPAPMGHSFFPGRNLHSMPGFSPGTISYILLVEGKWDWKHQSRIYCDASGHH